MTAPADEPHLPLLEGVAFQPVFIMGDHRSGTTLLYKALGLTGCFNICTVYHLLKYDELLSNHLSGKTDLARQQLNEHLAACGLTTRLIDNLEVSADLPEEYGIFLHGKTKQLKITPGTFPWFMEFCRKVQLTSDPSRTLLLKNPWDFSNFVYVKQRLPAARYIFIHRHPVHVVNSQLKAMQTNWLEGNPYTAMISETFRKAQGSMVARTVMRTLVSPRNPLHPVLRVMTRRVIQQRNYYAANIGAIPASDYVTLRYEDLCQRPAEEIGRILAFLQLEARQPVDYVQLIQPRAMKLLPEVERAKGRLCARLGPLLADHGYDPI